MNETHETNPMDTLTLAGKALAVMAESQASAGEKVAALKTAAFAIEQAATAQSLAVVMANIISGSQRK